LQERFGKDESGEGEFVTAVHVHGDFCHGDRAVSAAVTVGGSHNNEDTPILSRESTRLNFREMTLKPVYRDE
jgi:hypothetical protein